MPNQSPDDAAFDRTPPHDNDAEMCALASLMLAGDDEQLFASTASQLRPESFYSIDHRIIFAGILALRERTGVVDAILLRDELKASGQLDMLGGTGYLGEILGRVPSAAHGPHYAKVVAEKYGLRQIISAANAAIASAYRGDITPGELAATTMGKLLDVASAGIASRVKTMREAAELVRKQLDGECTKVPTGIGPLDREIAGISLANFTIIGGRPGMGKSLVGKCILHNCASRGEPVGLVSIEEDLAKIGQNAAAMESGVDNRKINANQLDEPERDRVLDALGRIESRPIHVIDDVFMLRDVEAAVTTLALQHKCRLVVVDHIHLIEVDDSPREEGETRKVSRISRRLKALGKRLGIALVALSQLNRGNEQRADRPQLKDIRESGSLEQDGDLIILLHREDYYHRDDRNYTPDGYLELLIRKNKHGRCGCIVVSADMPTQRIVGEPPARPDDEETRVNDLFGPAK